MTQQRLLQYFSILCLFQEEAVVSISFEFPPMMSLNFPHATSDTKPVDRGDAILIVRTNYTKIRLKMGEVFNSIAITPVYICYVGRLCSVQDYRFHLVFRYGLLVL